MRTAKPSGENNPYAPPAKIQKTAKRVERIPTSLRQAIWFGMVRGAFFAGKLIGAIITGIVLLTWVGLAVVFFRAWYLCGAEAFALIHVASMLHGVFLSVVIIVMTIGSGAFVGSIIMGISAAVEYRRRPLVGSAGASDVPPNDAKI